VYYHFVGATEPASYTWSDIPESSAGGVVAYSGVDTVTPINTAGGGLGTATGQVSAPSITTTRDNNVILAFYGVVDVATITAPSSMNTLWTGVTSNAGGSTKQVTVLAAEQNLGTAGATGTRTATHTSTNPSSVGQLIALQPPARPYVTSNWTPSMSTYATGQTFTRSSGGTVVLQASLAPSVNSRTGGPLTPGADYTVALTATYNNWVSATTFAAFTARSC
jgi:hypothetical protein